MMSRILGAIGAIALQVIGYAVLAWAAAIMIMEMVAGYPVSDYLVLRGIFGTALIGLGLLTEIANKA